MIIYMEQHDINMKDTSWGNFRLLNRNEKD